MLEQATEMIYPEDDNGPGAIELGVPYFIDKQLAGQWGDNSNDYRQGPFTNESVDESSLTRGQMFLLGIRRINEYNEEFITGGGGVIIGDNPDTSAVNTYSQMWDMENLFVVGASSFPLHSSSNPTGTVGALAYRASEGMKEYMKNRHI